MEESFLVTKFGWYNIDFKDLICSTKNKGFITENDVDKFIEGKVKHVSKLKGIDYEYFFSVVRKQNFNFYEVKKEIFKENYFIKANDINFWILQNSFMFPDMESVRLNKAFNLFLNLSDIDQELFVKKIINDIFYESVDGKPKEKLEYLQDKRLKQLLKILVKKEV